MKRQIIMAVLLVGLIATSGCYMTPQVLEKSRVQMQEAGDERSQLKIGTWEAIKSRPMAYAGGLLVDTAVTGITVYGGYVLSQYHDHEKASSGGGSSSSGVHVQGDGNTTYTIYNEGGGRAWQDQSEAQ